MLRLRINLEPPQPLTLEPGEGPRLAVEWSGGWAELRDKIQILRTRFPMLPPESALVAFRGASVEHGWPARAFLASLGFHIAFLLMPLPEFLTRPAARPANLETVRIEYDLQWTGTSPVLPPIAPAPNPSRPPSPGGEENKPLPPRGADKIQPQVIVSNPAQPNHPTQTLLSQHGLERARVNVGELRLPNVVIPPANAPAPELDLQRIRIPDAPVDLTGPPQHARPPRPRSRAELALADAQLENLLPRLTLPTGPSSDSPGDAPDIAAQPGVARSGDLTAPGLIALSANPAAPTGVLELPDANLRARFSTGPFSASGSPGSVPGGVPGAQGGSGGGPGGIGGGPGGLSAPDIMVSPAGPVPAGPIIVGPGIGSSDSGLPPPPPQPETRPAASRPAGQTPPARSLTQRTEEMLGGLTPGSRLSSAYGGRRVYTIYINMPNLTSQSGSWVLRFAELGGEHNLAAGGAADYPIAAPVAMRKVDPRYPAAARQTGIEGSVLLYGIIRADGSVDSVQVVRGLHTQLDDSAVDAFRRWHFQPGQKNGSAVPLEVVVEIPFRLSKLF
ncbi:MAG: TonB family protein [Candidatus Acidiferrales bacterium]